jgi:hypothetical protein
MASSSDWGKVAATSLARRETSDLRNQLRHCCWWLQLCIDYVIDAIHECGQRCVAEVCLNSESSSRPLS